MARWRLILFHQPSLGKDKNQKKISYKRRGWDSNPRGQSPMDKQSIALTTRPPRRNN